MVLLKIELKSAKIFQNKYAIEENLNENMYYRVRVCRLTFSSRF